MPWLGQQRQQEAPRFFLLLISLCVSSFGTIAETLVGLLTEFESEESARMTTEGPTTRRQTCGYHFLCVSFFVGICCPRELILLIIYSMQAMHFRQSSVYASTQSTTPRYLVNPTAMHTKLGQTTLLTLKDVTSSNSPLPSLDLRI